jgi:hypothetical protein
MTWLAEANGKVNCKVERSTPSSDDITCWRRVRSTSRGVVPCSDDLTPGIEAFALEHESVMELNDVLLPTSVENSLEVGRRCVCIRSCRRTAAGDHEQPKTNRLNYDDVACFEILVTVNNCC